MKMNRTVKIIILTVLGISLAIGAGALMFYKSINVPMSNNTDNVNVNNSENKSNTEIKHKNILFVGDADGLSDTIFVVSYDPVNKKIDMLSIPRDTYYPRYGFNAPEEKKINAAYSEEKIDGLKKAVENIITVNIDNYVILSYDGFKKIVDAVGGVEVNIPFNMKYDDNESNPPLHIDLKKGTQVLDGEKALQYVRYRHGYAEGDLGRINAQQEFLKSFIDKVMSPSILPKLPSLAITLSRSLKTDLSISDITKYAYEFVKSKPASIDTRTLPGEGRYQGDTSYFFADAPKTAEIVAELFGSKNSALTASNSVYSPDNNYIKVEVLNGSGAPGIATKYADLLKSYGFDVVRIGNVSGIKYSTSHVYAGSDENKAKKVADILSIKSVESNVSSNSSADVIVILGKDKN